MVSEENAFAGVALCCPWGAVATQKLDNKTLTGRYDMKQLIRVQQVRRPSGIMALCRSHAYAWNPHMPVHPT